MRLHWGVGVAATYVTFAAATSGFVTFAMRQPVELVRPDYYEYSLAHDAHREAAARAAALGDRFGCAIQRDGRQVTLTWPREQVGRIRGRVWLYRPSDAGVDRELDAAPGADGIQQVSLAGLPAGRWLVRLRWQVDGVAYLLDREVVAP